MERWINGYMACPSIAPLDENFVQSLMSLSIYREVPGAPDPAIQSILKFQFFVPCDTSQPTGSRSRDQD